MVYITNLVARPSLVLACALLTNVSLFGQSQRSVIARNKGSDTLITACVVRNRFGSGIQLSIARLQPSGVNGLVPVSPPHKIDCDSPTQSPVVSLDCAQAADGTWVAAVAMSIYGIGFVELGDLEGQGMSRKLHTTSIQVSNATPVFIPKAMKNEMRAIGITVPEKALARSFDSAAIFTWGTRMFCAFETHTVAGASSCGTAVVLTEVTMDKKPVDGVMICHGMDPVVCVAGSYVLLSVREPLTDNPDPLNGPARIRFYKSRDMIVWEEVAKLKGERARPSYSMGLNGSKVYLATWRQAKSPHVTLSSADLSSGGWTISQPISSLGHHGKRGMHDIWLVPGGSRPQLLYRDQNQDLVSW